MIKEIKCEAYGCDERSWGSVPTLFGEGFLCRTHLGIYKTAERKKWEKTLKKLTAPQENTPATGKK